MSELLSPELEGYWLTEGYGYILEIRDDKLTLYEITKISCLKLENLSGFIPKFPIDLKEYKHLLNIQINSEGKLVFEVIGITIRYIANKIDKLPLPCENMATTKSKDPIKNFEIFWHTFNEHYAFFKERRVDWQAVYEKFRPKLTAETDEKKLFHILTNMVIRLKDMHISINADETSWLNFRLLPHWLNLNYMAEARDKDDELSAQEKPSKGKIAEFYENIAFRDFLPLIKEKYLEGNINRECNGMIFHGIINDVVGYIYVAREGLYLSDLYIDNDPIESMTVLNRALDKIVGDLQDTNAIILDLRFNMGGNDFFTLAIVERFADQKRRVIAKQAINGNELSPLWKFHVDPSDKKVFSQKKVVVLTSGLTLSSGEVQTIAMSAFPNVTTIGEPTMGCLSDTLLRHLPNGWTFTLSNEIFYSYDMTVHEAVRFQPHIKIKMDPGSFKDGRDNILERALEFIKEEKSS